MRGCAQQQYRGPDAAFASALLKRAVAGGGDFAELFVEDRWSLSLRLEDSRLEQAVCGNERGASLRLVRDSSTYFGYVDSVEEARIAGLVEEMVFSRRSSEAGGPILIAHEVSLDNGTALDPLAFGIKAKAELLRIADDAARSLSKEVRQVVVVYAESHQRVWIAGPEGGLVTDERPRALVSVVVTAKRGETLQTGRETVAQCGESEILSESLVRAAAEKAARTALVLLDARPAPAGRMPVVVGNGFGGVLFHEACGHGLEADFVAKKSSVWAEHRGKRVAGEHVSAYDDGSWPGLWGSGLWDDEGTATQRTVLIEAGVLTGYLTDRIRAARLGLPRTGNGRRQDYRSIPYPRMTNTYIAPGSVSPDEVIADTARGLYAKTFSGGQVDPATGDFVFGIEEGYLIERGQITAPVRGATLVGNSLEVLRQIDVVADDLDFQPGMCGKEGQGVPVGTGQPTLRIREMTVGGTSL